MFHINKGKTMDVREEIEAQERELKDLLFRVLPLRGIELRLESHQQLLDALTLSLEDLSKERLPELAVNAIRTEKILGKLKDQVTDSYDEHGALLEAQSSALTAHTELMSDLLSRAQVVRASTSTALENGMAAIDTRLGLAEDAMTRLSEHVTDFTKSTANHLEERAERLEKKIGEFALAQSDLQRLSTENAQAQRRLCIITLVVAGLAAAVGIATLAYSIAT